MSRPVQEYTVDPVLGLIYGQGGKVRTPLSQFGYVRLTTAHGHVWGHRLVWEAVHGPIPDGMQINHLNGIKHDNRIANLEVCTPKENMRHAYTTGLKGRRRVTA